jgi:hypothetical protein
MSQNKKQWPTACNDYINSTDFYILQQKITINLKQGKSVCGAGFVVQSTHQWMTISYTMKIEAQC